MTSKGCNHTRMGDPIFFNSEQLMQLLDNLA